MADALPDPIHPAVRGVPVEATTWRELIADILAWQRATFPHGTPESVAAHLVEEAAELQANPRSAEEVADVLILAFGVADRAGIDPLAAVAAKHKVNKARRWGAVESNGVVHHIAEAHND